MKLESLPKLTDNPFLWYDAKHEDSVALEYAATEYVGMLMTL